LYFFDRYRNGDYESVWSEMFALGAEVRKPDYQDDAVATARETMKRARHNVELLCQRLARIQYEFKTSPHTKPAADVEEKLTEFEVKIGGPLPIAIRTWYEIVGEVNFIGQHPELSPQAKLVGQGAITLPDPLVVSSFEDVSSNYIAGLEEGGAYELYLELAPDDLHKSNTSGGAPYGVRVPDPRVDSEFLHEWNETTFVSYVRIALGAGGFPGWFRNGNNRPDEILNYLTADLLSL
jgi:hypothetical protein